MIYAIIAADIHCREDNPICRTDNFLEAFRKKMRWLSKLQLSCGKCPVLISGDLFHRWKATPLEISTMISLLPTPCVIIPGQHDLPAHNLSEIHRGGIAALALASEEIHLLTDKVRVVEKRCTGPLDRLVIVGYPWGVDLDDHPQIKKGMWVKKIALIHHHVYKGRAPFPGADMGVSRFMKHFRDYDLIISGDNHIPFTHESEGRLLVNPGSFTRQRSDQADHRPRVYLYDGEQVIPKYIPIEEGVISREHIEEIEIRDEKIAMFVRRLVDDLDLGTSFERNLDQYLSENNIPERIARKIRLAMEEE